MTPFGRRHFCAALGAGMLGLVGAMAGCSSTDDTTASAPAEEANVGGVLAGLSLQVRRDPG